MKILITGGSGFIGINFIKCALKRGHKICNIDNLSLNKKDYNKINNNYFFNKADLHNIDQLQQIIRQFNPDKIIHMAAESHVDNSIVKPKTFLNTNIIGTYNILQASLNFWNGKKNEDNFCFHHISTDEVFGSLEYNDKPFNEASKYKPNSPYSASKASSDHLVRAWHKTYGLPITITYSTNNYGPYQHPEKFIPVTILSSIFKSKIPIYGNGENIRDWLYVTDHVQALMDLMENNIINKIFTIGSENEKSNLEVAYQICEIMDNLSNKNFSHKSLICLVDDRMGHDYRYAINPDLIKKEINWRPKLTFSDGIIKTINWYIQNKSWWKNLIVDGIKC